MTFFIDPSASSSSTTTHADNDPRPRSCNCSPPPRLTFMHDATHVDADGVPDPDQARQDWLKRSRSSSAPDAPQHKKYADTTLDALPDPDQARRRWLARNGGAHG